MRIAFALRLSSTPVELKLANGRWLTFHQRRDDDVVQTWSMADGGA